MRELEPHGHRPRRAALARTPGSSTSARSPPPTRATSRRSAARSARASAVRARARPRRRRRGRSDPAAASCAPPAPSPARARGRTGWRGRRARRWTCASSPSAARTCSCAERAELVRGQIYPVPDPSLPFLGVHLSRTVARRGAARPDRAAGGRPRRLPAVDACAGATSATTLRWPGTARLVRRFWRTGLHRARHAASRRALVARAARYVPEIGPDDVEPGPARRAGPGAGARRRAGRRLRCSPRPARALHVLNAPSPAATASLAIARLVADRSTAQAPRRLGR